MRAQLSRPVIPQGETRKICLSSFSPLKVLRRVCFLEELTRNRVKFLGKITVIQFEEATVYCLLGSGLWRHVTQTT